MENGHVRERSRVVKYLKSLILPLLLSSFCSGVSQNIVVNQFSGLDTTDPPSAIQPNQSQDLLNVRLQPGGRSVYKRDGYGLFQTLDSISSATVHGGYHFQQTTGSNVQLWGSDVGLYASVNDNAFVRVATGTVGATWQCTDNLGFAYCVTSSGVDTPVKTDGTVANTTYQGGIPAGTIVTSTPLQLVVSGVSGNASSVYISSNNAFSSFGSGPLPTDPYIEIINAPGSRITHMGYYFGNIYWWKDQSFGYISGSASQGTVGVTIVSNQIGTLDNSSAFWNPTNYDTGNHFTTGAQQGQPVSSGNPYFNELSALGGIFFRGQDNHIYQYDGYNLTRLSRIITPNITASQTKKANSWTQTSQADFQMGISTPPNGLSLTISPGDVTVSSFTVYFDSKAWNIQNNGFETNAGPFTSNISSWTSSGAHLTTSFLAANHTVAGSACAQIGPRTGSSLLYGSIQGTTYNSDFLDVFLLDASNNFVTGNAYSSFATVGPTCSWTRQFISGAGRIGQVLKLQFKMNNGDGVITSSTFTLAGDVSWYQMADSLGGGSPSYTVGIDDVFNGETNFTSTSTAVMHPGYFTYQTVGTSSATVQFSTNNVTGPWTSLLTSSNTTISTNSSYVRVISTFTRSASDSAGTDIQSVTIIETTTGTYYSQVNNEPNLTSWNSFTSDYQLNGGTIAFYARTSTTSFTILSATPTWIPQTANTSVQASTGTFIQLRADFGISQATNTPALNDFTFNWFEGTSADKAYINYFQDAIWFSVSSGSGTSTNNSIFYLDLLNSTWLKDSIPANGFAVENNTLYLGDPLSSKIYKFGGFSADNNLPIQSYWKSMDFAGADPTVQNEFMQADFSFLESSNTVAYTYAIDQSTNTTVFNIPLFSSKSSILKRGFLLPVGKIGTYYNFSVGDNSTSPKWTLIGHRAEYNPLNWIPQVSG